MQRIAYKSMCAGCDVAYRYHYCSNSSINSDSVLYLSLD